MAQRRLKFTNSVNFYGATTLSGIVHGTENKTCHALIESSGYFSGKEKQKPRHLRPWAQ